MEIFVIVETGFEYNDEIYTQGESGGGEPIQAYTSEDAAKVACDEKTLTWVEERCGSRYDSVTNYGYSPDEVMNLYKFSTLTGISEQELKDAWAAYNGSMEKILKSNMEAVTQCLNIKPFKVVGVELD